MSSYFFGVRLGGTAVAYHASFIGGTHVVAPLDPRLDLRRHSPDGFEWGYCGSGPAQLALAVASAVLGDDARALAVYQSLKRTVFARIERELAWIIPDERADSIVAALESGRGVEALGRRGLAEVVDFGEYARRCRS